MNLDQLKALCAVADQGTFAAAAESLNLTQPALSAQVHLLEDSLGTPLFFRVGRRKTLTEAGSLALDHARRVLADLDRMSAAVGALRGLEAGTLSLAAGDTVTRGLLLGPLTAFRRDHPGVRLHVWNRTSAESLALVASGAADLAVVSLPVQVSPLTVLPWKEYRYVAVRKCAGEVSSRLPLGLDELSGECLLLLESGTRLRASVEALYEAGGRVMGPVVELGGTEVQIDLARIGVGTAVVPDFAPGMGDPALEVRPIVGMAVGRLGLVTRSDAVPPAAQALLALLAAG
jgi:LysR family nitrogen assimilation transcriptional regulator